MVKWKGWRVGGVRGERGGEYRVGRLGRARWWVPVLLGGAAGRGEDQVAGAGGYRVGVKRWRSGATFSRVTGRGVPLLLLVVYPGVSEEREWSSGGRW